MLEVYVSIGRSWNILIHSEPLCMQGDKQSGSNDSGSTSAGQSPRLKSLGSRSFLSNDVSHAQLFEIRI